jgi:IS5 family transposase
MIKYTPANQLTLSGFSHPFEQSLSPNRWVKLARIIPWDALASVYSKSLNTTCGRESIDVRMVIGAIIVKHKIGLDDRGTVAMISENIYLQYFCGLTSFQSQAPFHPTVFVDIRKRMGANDFDIWNALIIKEADDLKPAKKKMIRNDDDQINPPKNKGTLKIDGTVANQKIVFPTDAGLLNTARKESERLIDLLHQESSLKKPRDYRRIARTEYLVFSKKRRKSIKEVRKFIGKQLGYVKRNLAYIEALLGNIESIKKEEIILGLFSTKNPYPSKFPLPKRDQKIYWVLQQLYNQQRFMYQEKTHSIKDRIVNIYQPYVRPIPRGKDKASTEFGAKISASVVDGMSRVEHINWDQFNESTDLELQVNMYKKTFGQYPELVLADQIYLNRKNRKWLKEKAIRIVGKPLGRPVKRALNAYQKRKLKKERNQRNHIEGKFGQAKNAYGLSNIKAKRSDTSQSWIGAIFFIMNLITLEKIANQYAIFCALFENYLIERLFCAMNIFFANCSKISYNTKEKQTKFKLKYS